MINISSFLEAYPADLEFEIPAASRGKESIADWKEIGQLLPSYSYGRGVYRLVRVEARDQWSKVIRSVFPNIPDGFLPFGYDWLGRFFLARPHSNAESDKRVLMCSLVVDQVLNIPASMSSFHSEILVRHPREAVEIEMFHTFLAANRVESIPPEMCADTSIPLWLGGEYKVENLKLTDIRVVWDLVGQLLLKVRDLPVGASISGVKLQP